MDNKSRPRHRGKVGHVVDVRCVEIAFEAPVDTRVMIELEGGVGCAWCWWMKERSRWRRASWTPWPALPEAGAQCANRARWDLCGGRRATGGPSASAHT